LEQNPELPEEDDSMKPWNIADESTMVGGAHVNGTMCATVFPAAVYVYPREIPTVKPIEDAVIMSRKFGAHENVSHEVFVGIPAAFAPTD